MSTHRLYVLLLPLLLAGCGSPALIAPATPTALTQPTRAAPSAAPIATSAPTQPAASLPSVQAINCTSPAALTPSQTEGPYFKAGSPERASLFESGMKGTKLVVTGYVLITDCKPIVRALVDFWQADANGVYDNNGYTLRGHQFTDANGRYQLTTVVPGLYTGRTAHIHVKVQAPNGPVVTSQLYFPGIVQNQRDSIFDPKLVVAAQNTSDGISATFNFVVNTK